MKNFFYDAFQTNIGRLISCLVLAGLSLYIANWVSWMAWVALGFFLLFPFPWFIVSMAYAWFINPITEYRENKILKKLWTDFNDWTFLMQTDQYSEDWNQLGNKYVRNYKILKNIKEYKTPMDFNNDCTLKGLY